ncbi:unnamed protein product, partial [Acidithrix sp. C25]
VPKLTSAFEADASAQETSRRLNLSMSFKDQPRSHHLGHNQLQ